MKKNKYFHTVALCLILLAFACKKEKNTPEDNDNELITTVELRISETGSGNVKTFKWEDIDGEGGDNPVIDAITLDAGKTYAVALSLTDKTKSPAVNTTAEIEEENKVHRFYFEPSPGSGITVSDLDNDDAQLPLGLHSVWTTSAAASGTMHIVLRHYANGGKESDDPVSSSKSSTDADVLFTVQVQ